MQRPQPTVLLADDEKVIRKLLRAALEQRGYSVIEASDGERALSLARNHAGPIHLLLAAVSLAKLDGASLADSLEAEREGLKVVLMASQPCPAGTRRVVQKPFSVSALLTELDTELARKPPRRQYLERTDRASNGY